MEEKTKNLFDYIDEMEPYLEKGHWDKLETNDFQVWQSLAGEKEALKINKINLKEYEYLLKQCFAEVLRYAQSVTAKAILFHYDKYNDWSSNFFVHHVYTKGTDYTESAHEDWACDYQYDIQGPSVEAFSKIYKKNYGDYNRAKDIGICTYLQARTIASFGRMTDWFHIDEMAICICYHGQGKVMRIIEIAD